jgi:1-acyl-sn-glycerol-3-phosphate acyltransferase
MKGHFVYDIFSWIFNIMLDIFFREIRPRGAHRIPKEGPVIFVAAPHANQVSLSTLSSIFFINFTPAINQAS